MRYAYLHGFASGPLSRKAGHLGRALGPDGIELHVPDLNVPSFEALSLTAMLAAMDQLDEEQGDGEGWRLIGSSLGGWVAARWAALRPHRVDRALLLCPAFNLAARWRKIMGEDALSAWERQGHLVVPDGAGVPRALHWSFYEESQEVEAFPAVSCDACVIHGVRDDRVPVTGSRQYVEKLAHFATLVEVDDGHDLLASQPRITEIVRRWLVGGDRTVLERT